MSNIAERFAKPKKVSDKEIAFGGDLTELLPDYKDIPREFKLLGGNEWCNWQARWFFEGLDKDDVPTAKEGISFDDAMRHLSAIQSSFRPKHEHKCAGVAYLASLWFNPLSE